MSFTNRVSQTLHDEHRATIALMERLEHLIARNQRGIPDTADRAVAQLLAELAAAVQADVQHHFDFEEQRLFTFLEEVGDGEIGAHLTSEHQAMRPLGERVASLAREAGAHGFDSAAWDEFRRLGQELCERMLMHVQKEEMALLPLLEEHMDSETEARLHQEYLETA